MSSECGAHGRHRAVVERTNRADTSVGAPNIPSKAQLKRLTNPRLMGLEIEVNGIPPDGNAKSRLLNETLDEWSDSVVHDGSIGDQPEAFELVLQPSSGDIFVDHVEKVCEGLKRMGARPNKECGLHVHIDARDLETYDLHRVISLYAKVERALFDLCDPRRLDGEYSKVCGKRLMEDFYTIDPTMFRHNLVKVYYYPPENTLKAICSYPSLLGAQIRTGKATKYNAARYNALNLHSFFQRRTIEFRHHEGTIDANVIIGWAMTCQELISASQRLTRAQVDALPSDSRDALRSIMPKKLHPYLQAAWTRNDAIANRYPSYRDKRIKVWG